MLDTIIQNMFLEPKASKFDPRSIGGLQMWFAADRITGLVDGNAVATWSDLSGNGRDATQATEAAKPVYKVDIVNGKPVVRFDGVDDYIETTSVTIAQPITICVLAKYAAVNTDTFTDSVSGTECFFRVNTTDVQVGAGLDISPIAITANAFQILIAHIQSNGISNIFKNGVAGTAGDAGSNTLKAVRIGGAVGAGPPGPLNGDIAELLIYNKALTAGQRRRIEGWWSAKYGIAA